ncbi:hypothetical protein [Occallatibacter savannae]|uniref:hypothetical protein n=1 Tax=Occallatibacter savannae TaxID=1002691 RepID=UPI000D698956|nr:hypothetical protein [Occallatibacter savannae]
MPPQSGHIIQRYHPKWWLRIFALGFFGFSFAGLIHFWGAIASGDQPGTLTEILIPALLTLTGLGISIYFFTTSVSLETDAIEVKTLFSRKRLAFSEIRGHREIEMADSDGLKTRYIDLEPVDRLRPNLRFQRIYNFDAAFDRWLSKIPYLDP